MHRYKINKYRNSRINQLSTLNGRFTCQDRFQDLSPNIPNIQFLLDPHNRLLTFITHFKLIYSKDRWCLRSGGEVLVSAIYGKYLVWPLRLGLLSPGRTQDRLPSHRQRRAGAYESKQLRSSLNLGSNFGEIYRALAVSFVREHFTPLSCNLDTLFHQNSRPIKPYVLQYYNSFYYPPQI